MIRKFLPLLFVGALAASCNNNSEAVEVEAEAPLENAPRVSQATIYKVAPSDSKVSWMGYKIVGDKHMGTLNVSDGQLAFDGNELVAGEFTIDMSSLVSTDLDEGSGKSKLEGHLKGDDFFDVDTHPTAKFTVVQIQPSTGDPNTTYNITGNLDMKGVSKSVTIPVKVDVTPDMVMATSPAFRINRTDWNVKYGSGITGVVGDKVISDDVELQINLKAVRS